MNVRLVCLEVLLVAWSAAVVAEEAALRRPVALAASADQQFLYVANQRSGTLSVVDLKNHKVADELPLGKRPAAAGGRRVRREAGRPRLGRSDQS